MDIRSYFQSDRSILILCIFVASVIWFLNKMSQEMTTEVFIPIHIEIPTQYVSTDPHPERIAIGIAGTGWQLMQSGKHGIDHLELSPIPKTGFQTWSSEQLQQKLLESAYFKEVEILSLNPSRVQINLEQAHTKCIPIVIPRKVSFERGYSSIAPFQIQPDSVCVTGPFEPLQELHQWTTDTVIHTNLKTSIHQKLSLAVPDSLQHVFHLNPDSVTYQLEVEEFTTFKKIASIEAIVEKVDSISLFPKRAHLSMNVPISKYREVEDIDLNLHVNIPESLDDRIVRINWRKDLPYWIKNISVQPKTVEYYLIEPSSEDSTQTIE